ncbi:FAD-dependent monooxygenase [Pseudonocardia sp. RS010]|uniref:FAD-dependent monooxygenase n=1 Tax=Pseudonocardia sp. RS010 TaxID=3385979 RepID=UPI0039A35193
MTPHPDLLVVGAGPTGLALALQAHAHGARVRVVERRPSPFRPSRALIVHPRTLEVLRPLGVVDALLARADTAPAAHLHLGRRVVPVRLTDVDLPDTAYPHLTLLRQADVETVLDRALAERGVRVERGTDLTEIADAYGARSRVTLRGPAGIERGSYRWVVGCDGADSTVRRAAGIGWHGGGYRPEIVLADLELDGDLAPGAAHVVAGRRGLLFVFALGECATWRLLATRPCTDPNLPFGRSGPPVDPGDLQRLLDDAGLPARIRRVAWSSVVRVQHRLAATYRRGPLIVAGDAAHTHSPAAAQGMNTGIQDAANLGWKLALAATSTAPEQLVDSYDRERRPVARHVLALTHAVFWAEAGTDPLASFVRGTLAPLGAPVVPVALRLRRPVAEVVRLLARFGEHYRSSPISVEARPRPPDGPHAGDRLPDATATTADGRRVRLHALLAHPGVHVLQPDDPAIPAVRPTGPLVHVHRLAATPWTGGVLAVRPDGHIGFRGAPDGALRDWLARVGATPAAGGRPPEPDEEKAAR